MTQETFINVVEDQIQYCRDLLGLKGDEYDTFNNDRLLLRFMLNYCSTLKRVQSVIVKGIILITF